MVIIGEPLQQDRRRLVAGEGRLGAASYRLKKFKPLPIIEITRRGDGIAKLFGQRYATGVLFAKTPVQFGRGRVAELIKGSIRVIVILNRQLLVRYGGVLENSYPIKRVPRRLQYIIGSSNLPFLARQPAQGIVLVSRFDIIGARRIREHSAAVDCRIPIKRLG